MANELENVILKHKTTGKTKVIEKKIFARLNSVGGAKDYELVVDAKKVEKAIEAKLEEKK